MSAPWAAVGFAAVLAAGACAGLFGPGAPPPEEARPVPLSAAIRNADTDAPTPAGCCHLTVPIVAGKLNGPLTEAQCAEHAGTWSSGPECHIACCSVMKATPCDDPAAYCIDHFESTTRHDCLFVGGSEVVPAPYCTAPDPWTAAQENLAKLPSCCLRKGVIDPTLDRAACLEVGGRNVWTRSPKCTEPPPPPREPKPTGNGAPVDRSRDGYFKNTGTRSPQ